MSTYQYKPLPDECSIRVLSLAPSSSYDRPIHIKLRIQTISTELPCSSVPYEALSYVWGAPQGDRAINCEQKTILITENCEDALRRLRRRTRSRTLLWIDAICINQSNLAECSRQVGIMTCVYANARRVVGWLGEHSLGTSNQLTSLWSKMFDSLLPKTEYHSSDLWLMWKFLSDRVAARLGTY